MTTVELDEHGAAVSVPLPDEVGRALAAARIVEAAPDPYRPGAWRLRAGGKVGAVALKAAGREPVILRIAPKVPVRRLFFLIGYAADPRVHRDGEVDVTEDEEIVPALAQGFERALERALRQGVLQGYRHTEEASPVVRGRVREADQVNRHHGRSFPVEIAYDDYGTDIAENRLLRGAVERLLPLHRVPGDVRRRLRHHRARLLDAEPLGRGARYLPRWRPSRLNHRYLPALRLAETILRGASVEHGTGGASVDGYLIDTHKVFEDFVCVALREALARYGGRAALQARGVYLDDAGEISMRPDLVWYGEDRTPRAVADAKYKAEKPEGFPDADLYQMLAYCTALGLRDGHLVYARGYEPTVTHQVRHSQIRIHQHALTLDRPPGELLAEIAALARAMTCGTSGTASGATSGITVGTDTGDVAVRRNPREA
ncbi:restriction endonuclease [Streptomyces sp. SID4928]|uniref:McrC family protein n=1 Tax=unclassified Streptomyces TaxID=2593676 RepID=UPI0001C1C39D|nr:McrBC 5-methylcytosine restriction system component [Streptomyces sp. ACT-1]EGE42941.1 5-methylcytosine restriction system component-like protein [Streptomyces sp. ACT-1]MYR50983.1 restriction endonuclease [Streptomyces sp. SID4928]